MIFVLFLSFLKSRLRLSPRMISVGVLLFCCFLIFFGEAKVAWQRASTLLHRESFVVLGHGYSWLDILRIWRDFPVFGTGLGTFGNISSMYKSSSVQSSFIYAHNDYLQLLSETGVAGFFSIAFFFIFYFYSVLKSWFKRRDSYVVCVVLGGIASVFSILTYSFLDFNLHIPAIALLFFVILGLVYRLTQSHFEDARAIS
jgi:O-antigen ligase